MGPIIGPAPAIDAKWCPNKKGFLAGEKSISSLIKSENYGLQSSLYSFNPPIVMFNKLNISFNDVNGF